MESVVASLQIGTELQCRASEYRFQRSSTQKFTIPDFGNNSPSGQKLLFLPSSNSLLVCRGGDICVLAMDKVKKLVSNEVNEEDLFKESNVSNRITVQGTNFVHSFLGESHLLVGATFESKHSLKCCEVKEKGEVVEYFQTELPSRITHVDLYEFRKEQHLILVTCEEVVYLLVHRIANGNAKCSIARKFESCSGAAFYNGRVVLVLENKLQVLDSHLKAAENLDFPKGVEKVRYFKRMNTYLYLLMCDAASETKTDTSEGKNTKTEDGKGKGHVVYFLDMRIKLVFPAAFVKPSQEEVAQYQQQEKEIVQMFNFEATTPPDVFVSPFPTKGESLLNLTSSSGSSTLLQCHGLQPEVMPIHVHGEGEGSSVGLESECPAGFSGSAVFPDLPTGDGDMGVMQVLLTNAGELLFVKYVKNVDGTKEEERVEMKAEAEKEEEGGKVVEIEEEEKEEEEEEEEEEEVEDEYIIPLAILEQLSPDLQENELLLKKPGFPISENDQNAKERLILGHHRILDAELLRFTHAVLKKKIMFEKCIANRIAGRVEEEEEERKVKDDEERDEGEGNNTQEDEGGWIRDDGEEREEEIVEPKPKKPPTAKNSGGEKEKMEENLKVKILAVDESLPAPPEGSVRLKIGKLKSGFPNEGITSESEFIRVEVPENMNVMELLDELSRMKELERREGAELLYKVAGPGDIDSYYGRLYETFGPYTVAKAIDASKSSGGRSKQGDVIIYSREGGDSIENWFTGNTSPQQKRPKVQVAQKYKSSNNTPGGSFPFVPLKSPIDKNDEMEEQEETPTSTVTVGQWIKLNTSAYGITSGGTIMKKILKVGRIDTGTPLKGSNVSVHYTGTFLNGKKFDSSIDRGTPFLFTLGQGFVIKGWDIGIATMKVEEKCILKISPEFAYGKRGSPPKIGPDATLLFEVELLSSSSSSSSSGFQRDDGGSRNLVGSRRRFAYQKPKYDTRRRPFVKAKKRKPRREMYL